MQSGDIKRFAVIGLGKMGVDWVANILEGGYEVVGYDSAPQAKVRAAKALAKALGWIGKKRHPDDGEFVANASARFTCTASEEEFMGALPSCQILLEVIIEDLRVKCDLLARLAPHLGEQALIWTNTSSLSVHTMGVASGRRDRLIGTHGMNPAYQMAAVEVVCH